MKARSILPPEEYLGQKLLEICLLVETRISHELNLINHRMSWLAASQTVLVLTTITLVATYDEQKAHPSIRWVLISIPVIGVLLCAQVHLAVRAAVAVMQNHLLPERSQLMAELNRLAGTSLAELGPNRLTDYIGAIPAKWIPVTFMFMWFFFLFLAIWRVVYP